MSAYLNIKIFILRYHLAQYPFPGFVYDRNEVSFFVKQIYQGLLRFFNKECVPEDPLLLSYWFVQNFQLNHGERLEILSCDTVLERLRMELNFMQLRRYLCCAHCQMHIAEQTHVFAMSKEGVQSNYCNPAGQVYETVTVLEAQNYDLVGLPSKQFSWFPGWVFQNLFVLGYKCLIDPCRLWVFPLKES